MRTADCIYASALMDRLKKAIHSEINSIRVRDTIFKDNSTKTFVRPEWKRLETNLKKHKGNVDLVPFTKWDRFSRNVGDAY